MSQDLCFKTKLARLAGFPVKEGETLLLHDEENGEIFEKKMTDTQDVAGWQGIVCPGGDTLVIDKPETRAALKAAGIPFDEC